MTRKAAIYVYQDFWAQMLVYNMLQDIRHAADEHVSRRGKEAGFRYPLRINENLALGLFKEQMICILLAKRAPNVSGS